MKRVFIMISLTSMLLLAGQVFSQDQKTPAPPAKASHAHAVKQDGKAMKNRMMQCPMMKQHHEIKAILKQVLALQERSLNAASREKTLIRKEVANLIKKIDAMPDKMDCPMMQMMTPNDSGKNTPAENQTKEEIKASGHQH